MVSATKALLRQIPGAMQVRRLIGRGEHALTLRFARRQNILFTEFQRVPTQLAVLAGPVLDFLRPRGDSETLRIVMAGGRA